jgi:hypothetical protein
VGEEDEEVKRMGGVLRSQLDELMKETDTKRETIEAINNSLAPILKLVNDRRKETNQTKLQEETKLTEALTKKEQELNYQGASPHRTLRTATIKARGAA